MLTNIKLAHGRCILNKFVPVKTVIHISVSAGMETTGSLALSLARHAAAHGWKAVVAYGRGKAPDDPQVTFFHIGSLPEKAVHLLKRRLLGASARGSSRATAQLIRFIEQLKPDVIHLHNLHGYYLDVPALLEYLAHSKARVIFTLHDRWAMTGRCAVPGSCHALDDGCSACPYPGRYPATHRSGGEARALQWKIKAFSGLQNLTVVGVSSWISSLAADSHLGSHPIVTIPNGTAVPDTTPSLPVQKKVLLVAHRWTQEKGADRLSHLRELLPENIGMEIIGLNAQSFMPGAEHRADCIFKGHMSHPEVLKEMEQASALVILSRHESFSMTKIEALMHGTPVAALDCEGVTEGLDDMPGVALAESMESLEKKIVALVEHTSYHDRQRIAELARRRFSIERMAESYLGIYGN